MWFFQQLLLTLLYLGRAVHVDEKHAGRQLLRRDKTVHSHGSSQRVVGMSSSKTLADLAHLRQLYVMRMERPGPDISSTVAQILILTVDENKGQQGDKRHTGRNEYGTRADVLMRSISDQSAMHPKIFVGVDYRDFTTELEEMQQQKIPMSLTSRGEWLKAADFGRGLIHKASIVGIWNKGQIDGTRLTWKSSGEKTKLKDVTATSCKVTLKTGASVEGNLGEDGKLHWSDGDVWHREGSVQFPPNGALACSLGHHRMWEMAASLDSKNDGTNRTWTVILEDDAMPSSRAAMYMVSKLLAKMPPGVEMVHLDDRHCRSPKRYRGFIGKDISRWAFGSTAYAITAKAARALLAEPFQYAADHWLNAPVINGKFKVYCPIGRPFFIHGYKHTSLIGASDGRT
jgi:hypothetical protein